MTVGPTYQLLVRIHIGDIRSSTEHTADGRPNEHPWRTE